MFKKENQGFVKINSYFMIIGVWHFLKFYYSIKDSHNYFLTLLVECTALQVVNIGIHVCIE